MHGDESALMFMQEFLSSTIFNKDKRGPTKPSLSERYTLRGQKAVSRALLEALSCLFKAARPSQQERQAETNITGRTI